MLVAWGVIFLGSIPLLQHRWSWRIWQTSVWSWVAKILSLGSKFLEKKTLNPKDQRLDPPMEGWENLPAKQGMVLKNRQFWGVRILRVVLFSRFVEGVWNGFPLTRVWQRWWYMNYDFETVRKFGMTLSLSSHYPESPKYHWKNRLSPKAIFIYFLSNWEL